MMTPSRVLVAKAGRARPRRVVCTPATSLTSLRYLRRLVAASAEQETAAETSEQAGHLESRAGRTYGRTGWGELDSQSQRRAEDLLDSIFKVATELVRGERASLLLREDNSADFVIARALGLADDVRRQVRVKPGEGVVGLVAASKRSLLVRDAAHAPIQAGEGSYRSDSYVSVPIVIDDEPRGVLSVTDRFDGQPLNEADLSTL